MDGNKPGKPERIPQLLRTNGLRLFLTAFTQVGLVAINTVFLTKGVIAGIAITSFGISWIWTHNVRKTAFGSETDRYAYAFGAAAGSLFGYFLTTIILEK